MADIWTGRLRHGAWEGLMGWKVIPCVGASVADVDVAWNHGWRVEVHEAVVGIVGGNPIASFLMTSEYLVVVGVSLIS